MFLGLQVFIALSSWSGTRLLHYQYWNFAGTLHISCCCFVQWRSYSFGSVGPTPSLWQFICRVHVEVHQFKAMDLSLRGLSWSAHQPSHTTRISSPPLWQLAHPMLQSAKGWSSLASSLSHLGLFQPGANGHRQGSSSLQLVPYPGSLSRPTQYQTSGHLWLAPLAPCPGGFLALDCWWTQACFFSGEVRLLIQMFISQNIEQSNSISSATYWLTQHNSHTCNAPRSRSIVLLF